MSIAERVAELGAQALPDYANGRPIVGNFGFPAVSVLQVDGQPVVNLPNDEFAGLVESHPLGVPVDLADDGVIELLALSAANPTWDPMEILCVGSEDELLLDPLDRRIAARRVDALELARKSAAGHDRDSFSWALGRLVSLPMVGRNRSHRWPTALVDMVDNEVASATLGIQLEEWNPHAVLLMSNPAIDKRYYLVTMLDLRAAGVSLTPDALAVLTSSRRGETRDELEAWTMLGERFDSALNELTNAGLAAYPAPLEAQLAELSMRDLRLMFDTHGVRAARKADLIEKSIAELGEATVKELSRDAVRSGMVASLHEPDLPLDDARVARLVEHFYGQDRDPHIPTAVRPLVSIPEDHFAIDGSAWDEDIEWTEVSAAGSGIPSDSVATAVAALPDTNELTVQDLYSLINLLGDQLEAMLSDPEHRPKVVQHTQVLIMRLVSVLAEGAASEE